jgi:MerR family transcriptional regulator, redox-sensitive transcriptional activator SoxR
MSLLSIGEAARRAGVSASAMRHYERVGLLPAPARVSGRRRYDEQIVARLGVIRLAQQAGFTLAEIGAFFEHVPANQSPGEHWRVMADRKLAEIDVFIAQAQATRRLLTALQDCRCASIEGCAQVRHRS